MAYRNSLRRPAKLATDASPFLVANLVLLLAIPSQLVIGALGGAGSPAQVLGLGLLLWWVWSFLNRPGDELSPIRSPVRTVTAIWVATVLVSYVAAMSRPIGSDELSTSNLGLVSVVSWVGILLVANDGISNLDRLKQVLNWLVVLGALLATLGLAQFITHLPLVDQIHIPGLVANHSLYGASIREGFTRPSATAVHPIEFGAVLTAILPIAIYRAIGWGGSTPLLRWLPVMAIAVAIAVSISRSALVCAAAALLVILPTLTAKLRLRMLLGIGATSIGVFLFIPGMIGSIVGLFANISTDSSAQSRTGSYGLAWDFIVQSPLAGRGLFTFLPRYRIFDNQYLLTVVETGFLGLLSLFLLFIVGISTAYRASRLARDTDTRYIALSLMVSILTLAIGFALFDAFSFPMVPGLLFLVLGSAGAVYRFVSTSFTSWDKPEVGYSPLNGGRYELAQHQERINDTNRPRRSGGTAVPGERRGILRGRKPAPGTS